MYINTSSLTTFVLLGSSLTNALVTSPRQANRFRNPTRILADATEAGSTDATTVRHESFADQLDNAVTNIGMSKLDKLFQGLTQAPETRHIKLDVRSELSEDTFMQDAIFSTLLSSIKDTLAEASEGSDSNDDIAAEDVGPLRDATITFANMLGEAASGFDSADIVARDAEAANGQLELLPVSSINSMVKEFGKVATQTAHTIAGIVEEIKRIAHEAKLREELRKNLVDPVENIDEGLKDKIEDVKEELEDVKDVRPIDDLNDKLDDTVHVIKDATPLGKLKDKLDLKGKLTHKPALKLPSLGSLSPLSVPTPPSSEPSPRHHGHHHHHQIAPSNSTASNLAARFIVPGLDPLTVTIHIMTTLMAETGYNYYKNKKTPQPDYAKAAYQAQSDRLAVVEQQLKNEQAMNAAIKKAHAAHRKPVKHTHN